MTMPGIYTQRDARWCNDVLGNNPGKPWVLYGYGCVVVSISNLIWTVTGDAQHTPKWANEWLRNAGGFTPDGGLVVWSVLDNNLPTFNLHAHGFSSDLGAVNGFLAPENNFAIAWLSKDGFPQHWALMPYVGMIADPWDGKLKPVTSYTFHGAHLYSFDNPPVQPPAPAPAMLPIQAPAVPVPSNETPVTPPAPEAPAVTATVPEWVATYKAWNHAEELTVVHDGAYAFDPETGKKLMDLSKDDSREYAGSFLLNGVRMVRGKAAADIGKWASVSASFFNEHANYIDGPVQVTVNPADPLGLGLPQLDDETKATFLQKLWEPIAWLFAVIINKKGIK